MKLIIGDFLRNTFIKKNLKHFAINGEFTEALVQEATERELIARVLSGYSTGQVTQGYRKGVLLVKINPQGFKRRVRKLVEGDYIFGQFKGRVEGEAPRKKVGVLHVGDLPEATFVDAVLYDRATLAEDGYILPEGVDYEIVTFLAKDEDAPEPMDTETLMHNHFLSDGGTSTQMSDSEFVEALRKSHEYWKIRAHIH